MRDRSLETLDLIKIVLMASVVLCHSMAFYGGGWFAPCILINDNEYLGIFSKWLGTFHVEGFTLVSGYIYCYIRNDKGGYRQFWPFARKKAKRLLIPYLAVLLLWCIPIGNHYFKEDLTTLFHKYFLGESPSQLWFLLMLFWCFIIAFPVFKMSTKKQITMVLTLFFTGTIMAMVVPNYFQLFTAFKFFCYFWIGYTLRRGFVSGKVKIKNVCGWFFLEINLISFALVREIVSTDLSAKIVRLLLDEVSKCAGGLMAFYILQGIFARIGIPQNKIKLIVVLTFPIYLIHQQLIYILLWNYTAQINPFLGALINFCVSIVLSVIISKICLKNKYSSFLLTGEARKYV